MVVQHVRGRINAEKGFPSSMYVTPIEQYPASQIFTVPTNGVQDAFAFVSLVTSLATAHLLKLDNDVKATGWEDLHQASVYRVLQLSISTGQHIIEHTTAVGVFIYAERSTCAFNYPAQMNVVPYSEVRSRYTLHFVLPTPSVALPCSSVHRVVYYYSVK